MAFDKAKFLARFIDEAGEHAKSLNEGLLLLEQNPADLDMINHIFRAAHTIKGSARMMKLITLSDFAHKLEDILDALRKQEMGINRELISLLLEGVAAMTRMLEQIGAGDETVEPPVQIAKALEKVALEKSIPAVPEPMKSPALPAAPQASPPPAALAAVSGTEAEVEVEAKPDAKPEAMPADKPCRKKAGAGKKAKPAETVRISADKLDELVKLMGEIVSGDSRSWQRLERMGEIEALAKRQAGLLASLENQNALAEPLRLELLSGAETLLMELKKFITLCREDLNVQSLLTADLQDRSLKMRMLPLSTLFDSFKLTVRNLAAAMGKDINFSIEGGQTELDKKIIEQIGDSLLHMIRNSIDHGIEASEVRRQAGKPEAGSIRLTAAYDGGNVAIEIADDGAGLPLEKLKAKAVQKGFFDEENIRGASDADIINLIFEPGFSTSDIITDFSGRGVGMDVVRKNIIENLKGAIQTHTAAGKGTTFNIKLPLTMAIVNVLLVTVAHIRFAVPINYIREVINIPAAAVIQVTDKKAVRLREQIIPIMSLYSLLTPDHDPPHDERAEYLILIASIGNEEFGLIVDSLLQEESLVIKPLPGHMANIRFVSGCIVSGDNEIVNVLHIPGIVAEARELRTRTRTQPKKPEARQAKRILVVDDSLSTREIEKGILESFGYEVSLAGDGEEGFKKALAGQYDLIITDIEMPRLNGLAMTEKLRQSEQYEHTPIILVTSLDKAEDKKKGVLAGADAYIVKGDFEQTTLLETVKGLIG